jgi:hypothetical protein
MRDIKDILLNIETIYGSNNTLNTLKDFERVIDELDVYVFDNWIDGELLEGPKESRYWISATFMWPHKKMPDPRGGKRLTEYGCKVSFKEDYVSEVRKIKTPDDIRPGTKKGKIDQKKVWEVEIRMPKKLIFDLHKGYDSLAKNKIDDGEPSIQAAAPGAGPQTEPVEQEAPQQ